MATTSPAVSHSVTEKSSGIGRCDFAPAWLKLASSSTSSQSRSLSSTSQNHTHSSFSTPRARTPNGFDFDQGSGRSTQGNSTSNTGAVSRNSEGGKGGIGGRPSFPVSGGRVYSDNVVRASVNGNNSAQPGYERSLSEQHHPYVRRQKSLDSFGRQDPAARRSPPPPSGRTETGSRVFDSGFRGARGGRGRSTDLRTSYEEEEEHPSLYPYAGHSKGREEDHAYNAAAQRSRGGRQTNGSTPSTNPNYFYYGTPPTPPNDPIDEPKPAHEPSDEEQNAANPSPRNTEVAFSHRRETDRGDAGTRGREHRSNGFDAHVETGSDDAASYERRTSRMKSLAATNGKEGDYHGDTGHYGGRGAYTREGKRHSSSSVYEGPGTRRFEEERRAGTSFEGGMGTHIVSAAGRDLDARDDSGDAGAVVRKREPPPPDAEEEFPSLGGASDAGKFSGVGVWLTKQQPQTISSSSSTRVQLKQQHMSNGSMGAHANGSSGSLMNGSIHPKTSLVPPKMSRPQSSSSISRPLSASSSGINPLILKTSVSNGALSGMVSSKENGSASPNTTMEIPRFVKQLKSRDEKKSHFLKALRDPDSARAVAKARGATSQEMSRFNEEEEMLEDVFEDGANGSKVTAVNGVAEGVQAMKVQANGKLAPDTEANPGEITSIQRAPLSPLLPSRRRRHPSSVSSGASLPSVDDSQLSSSLEAEQRLLREMGWEEEEEEDDWQISEDEVREVQLKIQEFHRNQHRNLTSLTLNVIQTSPFGDGNRLSSSDSYMTTSPDAACTVMNGMSDDTVPTAAFVISGFENNNHQNLTSPLSLFNTIERSPLSPNNEKGFEKTHADADADADAASPAWNNNNDDNCTLMRMAPNSEGHAHLNWTTTDHDLVNFETTAHVVAINEDTDSDLSDVDSD